MGGQYDPRAARNPHEVVRQPATLAATGDALHQQLEGTSKTYGDVGRLIYHYKQTGATYHRITELLEQDHGIEMTMFGVVSLYRNYVKILSSEIGLEERDQARYIEIDRLEALHEAVWHEAMAGDPKAVDAVLKIAAHRYKLYGLDALNGMDRTAQMNVLIVGQDKEAFIDALRAGRVAGSPRDDEGEAEEAT